MQLTIPKNISLLDFLKERFSDVSKRTLKQWVTHSQIVVDKNIVLNPQQIFDEDKPLYLLSKRKVLDQNVELLFEDAHFIIIEKPKNILSVPSPLASSDESVLKVLRHHFRTQFIFAIHRLDYEVSGVMIFARNRKALEIIKESFSKNFIKRQYVAIVHGQISEKSGRWECFLKEKKDLSMEEDEEGEKAITHFQLIKYLGKNFSLLSLELETGKKHQIRYQCAKAHFPIVGEKRYFSEGFLSKRLFLHSHRLQLAHPITKKVLSFTSPLPREFLAFGADNFPLGVE